MYTHWGPRQGSGKRAIEKKIADSQKICRIIRRYYDQNSSCQFIEKFDFEIYDRLMLVKATLVVKELIYSDGIVYVSSK